MAGNWSFEKAQDGTVPNAAGKAAACDYAEALTRQGRVIVSGNARGIDAAAHESALRNGEWLEVLDPDALLDAIKAGRQLLAAVERYAKDHGVAV